VESLLDTLPDDPGSTVITVKADNIPVTPPNGQKSSQNSPAYDPSVVYALEFTTTLALRDQKTIEELGKPIMETLQAILKDAARYHPITVARSSFYILRLLQESYVSIW
jgi:golgi-specific brefeldin A-resistance guanine nucleotide exchange factor 1